MGVWPAGGGNFEIWGVFCARNTFLNASQQRDFCVQRPPKCPKNFRLRRALTPLGGLCVLYKTHPKSQFFRLRRALGAIISFCRACSYRQEPRKTKNLVNPHWAERCYFLCLRRAKHIFLVLPIVFIRKTIHKTVFFSRLRTKHLTSKLRVYARHRRIFKR